jgi:geranyl-CoA carboxylase beta subunit
MPIIENRIDTSTSDFTANRDAMLALVGTVQTLKKNVAARSAAAKDRFRSRGQILPRERIAHLLDRGSPWLDLCPLAGYRMHDDDGKNNIMGGGVVAGIGFVAGVRAIVSASDSAIKGGTIAPMGLKKNLRVQQIARENKLPFFHLVESGGANLLYQAEIFVEGGRGFANQARLSAAGVPQITVVHGSSTAGGAYLPGLSDYVIMVKGRAKVFLAGPPLLKAATGETATDEELGGAEMHVGISGVGDFIAEDDADGIRIARELLAKLHWDDTLPPSPPRAFKQPRYPIDDILGIVPVDYRQPYDVRQVIARLVDDSDFLDFKPGFGPETVTGQAAIEGYALGLVGNNGPVDAAGAAKAAQFIQLCCQAGMPILYLQNTTGYMVGREAEQAGIVKHGSKMIQAVANATVPQLTLHIGASFGAGNYGMCGRSFDPRFIFAWPNNRVAVMGSEQAARVLAIVTEEKLRRSGQEVDREKLNAMEREIIKRTERESAALYATARLWDDGIIDPRDSRRILGFCLATCDESERRHLNPNTFGVARM